MNTQSTKDGPQTAPETETHTLQCMEVWGGSTARESGIAVHGIDAWLYSHPYRSDTHGGDIYYFSMCGEGRIARFVLADVAGHGHSVKDLAVLLRRLMHRNIGTPDQRRFARSLNRAFGRLSRDGIFATAAILTYFAPTDELIACLAGHPRPLWYRAATGKWAVLSHEISNVSQSSGGLPLGVIHPTEYHQFAVTLEKDDLVVLYSDALMESGEPGAKSIGEDGVLALVRDIDANSPHQFATSLIKAADDAFGRTPDSRSDDLTVLVLHHNAANPPKMSLTHKMRMMAKMMGI